MDRRVKRWLAVEPGTWAIDAGDESPPVTFKLVDHRERQHRAKGAHTWLRDNATNPEISVVARDLTPADLVGLISSAADWLAYRGEES